MDRALGFDWMALLGWLNDAPVDLRRAAADLRQPAAADDARRALPRLHRTAVVAPDHHARLHLCDARHDRDLRGAAGGRRLAALRPHRSGRARRYRSSARSGRCSPDCATAACGRWWRLGAEGVITFPSLHAALAVIMIAALWPIATLRWPILALECRACSSPPRSTARIISIDVLAGIVIAVLSLAAARDHGGPGRTCSARRWLPARFPSSRPATSNRRAEQTRRQSRRRTSPR